MLEVDVLTFVAMKNYHKVKKFNLIVDLKQETNFIITSLN
jgi:hypothetical protein